MTSSRDRARGGRTRRLPRPRLGPAPGTAVFLLLLAATTIVFALSDDRARAELLLSSSTNLDHLSARPLLVLVASAFWTPGSAFLVWALALVGISAPVERRLGTRRWLVVFAAGHVGATLLSLAGVAAAIRLGTVDPGVSNATDVGVSYGMGAIIAVFLLGLPPRVGRPILVALFLGLLGFLVVGRTFTDYGHLFAVSIGCALWWHGIARPARSADPGRAERAHRRGGRLALVELVAIALVVVVSALFQQSPSPAHGSPPAATATLR